jgi:hypothetical protein
MRRSVAIIGLLAVPLLGTTTAGATGIVNPTAQVQNLAVSQEREAQFDSPGFVVRLAKATAAYQEQRLTVDAGRAPNPNSCTTVALCPISPERAPVAT